MCSAPSRRRPATASCWKTLLFFNYLRQEFEDNFLLLLPPADRDRVRHTWTQGIGAFGLLLVPFAGAAQPTAVQTDDARPLTGLVEQIARHLGPVIAGPPDRLNPDRKPPLERRAPIASFDDWERAASTLTVIEGQPFTRYLPSVILLRLNRGEESRVYSLVVNRVYKSQFTLIYQDGEALPDQYSLSIYPTIINGFPNLFIELDMDQAAPFLTALRAVTSQADWERFKERYGILRNSARLWPFYDWITDWNFSHRKEAAGYLDLSYYDVPE
ncbi:fatty acid cis/trans isomerase [uncultured Lamprocystis sp.]|uniref:fatty acid cis/trans isomerase n=1 Tax=uncultured Lamprocystis sp. TaxID=543132 RepID=UPI0025E968D3|nr:fatty acid cis/trans isomerase [uncultured Lamprocystis sp.]